MDQKPEALTYTGNWWLAENPEHKVIGTLTVNPGDENKLSLFEKLGDQSNSSEGSVRFEKVEHGTILGRAKENVTYKWITLYRCSEIRLNPDFASQVTGVAESTLTPEVVLVGVHFADCERTFTEFEGQLLGLESWTHVFLPLPTPEFDDAGKVKAFSHRFEPPTPLRSSCHRGAH